MQKGQSLAEYSLAIGLIAVVCIAGLASFGGNLGSAMQGLQSALGLQPSSHQMNAAVAGGFSTGANGESVNPDLLPEDISRISLSVDPVTGKTLYQISGLGGAGTQVTSEEGATVMLVFAQELRKLAKQELTGEPIPDELAKALRRLSNSGENLGQVGKNVKRHEKAILKLSKTSGYYPKSVVKAGLQFSEAYLKYSRNYQTVLNVAKQVYGPKSEQYKQLKREVDPLVGPISYIANKETSAIVFNNDFKVTKVSLNSVASEAATYPNALTELKKITKSIPPNLKNWQKDRLFIRDVRDLGDKKQVGVFDAERGAALEVKPSHG